MIYTGDCLEVMAGLDAGSVDAVVTDPPYGIGFMGRSWDDLATAPNEARWNKRGRNLDVDVAPNALGGDFGRSGVGFSDPNPRCAICGKVRNGRPKDVCQCGDAWEPAPRINRQAQRSQEWHRQWATEAFRVAKPGAYLLAFGGTRTYHRLTCAIEDAGWIIRDCLVWAYASGFPKSRALLKPAWEPIVMARKPGPLRELAIDRCRIGVGDEPVIVRATEQAAAVGTLSQGRRPVGEIASASPLGRWPANVILTADEDGRAIFDGDTPGVVGGGETHSQDPATRANTRHGSYFGGVAEMENPGGYGDSGTYSRFFLLPKAARSEREPVLGGLPDGTLAKGNNWIGEEVYQNCCRVCGVNLPYSKDTHHGEQTVRVKKRGTKRQNVHPTVKPLDLMRHLVRLVTPTGGTVLDCFAGSGTTLLAAEMEGFQWIGIEREAEYVQIIEARLNGTQRGLGLPA